MSDRNSNEPRPDPFSSVTGELVRHVPVVPRVWDHVCERCGARYDIFGGTGACDECFGEGEAEPEEVEPYWLMW